MSAVWDRFLLAIQFLTRLPVVPRGGGDADELARCAPYFPLVGTLIGALAASAFVACSAVLPHSLAVFGALVAGVWITGALHEDGLADAADGLGGASDRARALEIMRDSRLGTFGAVAIWVSLGARFLALSSLGGGVVAALIAGGTASRWACFWMMRRNPYARVGSGYARSMVEGARDRGWLGAQVYTLAMLAICLGPMAVPVVLAGFLCVEIAGRYFLRRLGGITGDCIGAACQCVEIVTYIVLASGTVWARGG